MIGRPTEEGLLDETDIRFLLLIIRGYNNSYAIYNQLKAEAEKKGAHAMTYKNTNRRILILVHAEVIDEVSYISRVPHGRIDYRLTMKGLEYLIPYFFNHPEEIKELVEYLNNIHTRSYVYDFALLLLEKYTSATEMLNEYQKRTKVLYHLYGYPADHDAADAPIKFYERNKGLYDRLVTARKQMSVDMNIVEKERDSLISKIETVNAEIKKEIANEKRRKNRKRPT